MSSKNTDLSQLPAAIAHWAQELGFAQSGISSIDLSAEEDYLQQWLDAGHHAGMDYMEKHGMLRARPAELVPGTLSVISLRMDYLPGDTAAARRLADPETAYISRYALGRDYHKMLRKRLQKLADRIAEAIGPYGYRVFTDSAPLLEKALARNAGLGWVGKNTLVISRKAGSWFFLGEILTDLPLPASTETSRNHCGSCSACLEICPTQAFPAANVLDARRCISYLTIEYKGSIPLELRPLMGNRVFGCDDCQLVCPWNRFAKPTAEPDFMPRHQLDNSSLAGLFLWTEEEFLQKTEGSAIRRAGYEGWLRNLAIGLGNAPSTIPVLEALKARQNHPSELVREHVKWALSRHGVVN
ncbi:MAG: tRNA epoxyqueuosine(34) reductase QueG [Gammaproteobacteria bacterium]|nr:tRNA epoxyqueuosine(34) reductase QueG [Gammaproteobacteria bacterium]